MRALLVALTVFSAPLCYAALSPVEQTLADSVQHDKQSQLHYLQRLVNIQSGTSNTKGVRQVGSLLRNELNQLGFKTKWVNEPADMHRAGTLIAVHHGNYGKHLLLIGHLDTVFLSSQPFHRYSQKMHSATGQGVLDDKGGLVVMLYALKALHKAGELKDASVTIVLTGDEEDSGKPAIISRKPLLDAAKQADVTLDFEPASTLNTATIARRGITDWTITVHGSAAHSAAIFHEHVGVGAIFGLAHLLDEIREKLQTTNNLSFNPGLILGGSSIQYDVRTSTGKVSGKENIVARIAMAKGDLRYIDEAQKRSAEEKMREIIAAPLAGVKSQIDFVDGIPTMASTENNMKLLNEYSQISIDLKQGKVVPLDASMRGAADISYVAAIVPENLSGLGPIGDDAHTTMESLTLDSLRVQTQRAAILMSRLIKK